MTSFVTPWAAHQCRGSWDSESFLHPWVSTDITHSDPVKSPRLAAEQQHVSFDKRHKNKASKTSRFCFLQSAELLVNPLQINILMRHYSYYKTEMKRQRQTQQCFRKRTFHSRRRWTVSSGPQENYSIFMETIVVILQSCEAGLWFDWLSRFHINQWGCR